jgi:hypothetical protein
MNITVTIAGLEPLAEAISNLAAAIADRPLPAAPAETKTPSATAAAKPKASPSKAQPLASSASTTSAKPSEPVVDAGTGKPVEPAQAGVLTRDEVKVLATRLTQMPGGNATLKELFGKHGAAEMKLSAVPDENLPAIGADIEAALAG